MNPILKRLVEKRDELRSSVEALASAEDFNPEDENYVEAKRSLAQADAKVAEFNELMQARQVADALDGKMSKAAKALEQRSTDSGTERRSYGELFVESEEYRDYQGATRGRSGRVEIEAGALQTRALPTGLSDLVAAGIQGPKTTVDTTPPPQPTPLLDSISRVAVSGNAIEYVSWAKTAGGAAVVAEKAAKPSAEFAPTVTPDTLDTIAVYTQLTRQLIEDAPAVRSLIDQELIRDVQRAEEAAAAAALAAATLPTSTGTDLLAAIRNGIGEVQEAGYTPNAVLLNPADWAALDNVVMSATLNGPVIRQNFWGVVPIPSSGQAAGTATVGDFRTAMTQFYRSNIALYVTDSHADTFLSNVFTLLAERRSLTAVVRPQALVEVSVTTP